MCQHFVFAGEGVLLALLLCEYGDLSLEVRVLQIDILHALPNILSNLATYSRVRVVQSKDLNTL